RPHPTGAARSAFVKHGTEASAVPAARTVVYSRRSVHHQPIRIAVLGAARGAASPTSGTGAARRSEEHTSELQSPYDLVCRLLLPRPPTPPLFPYTTLFRSGGPTRRAPRDRPLSSTEPRRAPCPQHGLSFIADAPCTTNLSGSPCSGLRAAQHPPPRARARP